MTIEGTDCQFCFEKQKNCICTFVKCDECKKTIPTSIAMEYRGRVYCENHNSEEQEAKRNFERQEAMLDAERSVQSQANGEWHNGGYKAMKTDPCTGRPVAKVMEPARLKIYEGRR